MARSQYKSHESARVVAAELERNEKPVSIHGVVNSYRRLPEGRVTKQHSNHFKMAYEVLNQAVESYDQVTTEELSKPYGASRLALEEATNDLFSTIDGARLLQFPPEALSMISRDFISRALDPEAETPRHVREAMMNVGLAVGKDKVDQEIVPHIIGHHFDSLKAIHNNNASEGHFVAAKVAQSALDQFELSVVVNSVPSVADEVGQLTATVVEKAKSHGKKAALGGVAAVIATAVLAPQAARATEGTSSSSSSISVSMTNETPASDKTVVAIGVTAPDVEANVKSPINIGLATDDTELNSVIIANQPEKAAKSNVNVSVQPNLGEDTDLTSVTIATQPEKAPEKNSVSPPVGVDLETDTAQGSHVIISTVAEKAIAETKIEVAEIGIQEEIYDSKGEKMGATVEITAPNQNNLPKIDKENATPEQVAMYSIQEAIKNKGDMSEASWLIRQFFHDKSIPAIGFENGNPVYPATNGKLVEYVKTLQDAFTNVMTTRGHGDPAYVNDTLAALSLLEAAGHDQSVLNSADIQLLVTNVKKPTDAYRGKLFDRYFAKANEVLSANEGVLINGVSEEYRAQIQTLVAHSLMANLTDEQQAKEIQGIKDAEAKAAAEKAARNGEQVKWNNSAVGEAFNNLIERAGDPATKRAYMAMSYIMQKTGFNAVQAAGVIGNISVESASTFDPSIKQFGGGPGRGMFQHEGQRWIELQKFAAARGTTWDDFYTQLDFAIQEMPGRNNTLGRMKEMNSLYDATNVFLVRFETPAVVVHGYNTGDWSQSNAEAQRRTERGQAFLDAFNAELGAVNANRKAIAEAAAKAEAERRARESMTLHEADIWKDSTGVVIPEGTVGFRKVFDATGYVNGNPYPIGVAELDNVWEMGRERKALVNVRAAKLAYEMFEQMKKDLGLDVIVVADSFRTWDDQVHARQIYGNQAAKPGHSMHQAGYGFDIRMGPENGGPAGVGYSKGVNKAYPGNPIWEWLRANARKYHFYQYEEEGWHWSIDGN